jgi:SAM-dependent methyltransferase
MKAIGLDECEICDAPAFFGQRSVLNVGSGPRSGNSLHASFQGPAWREVRIDIDPATVPDVVGSFSDMRSSISSGSFDAVWSSHSLEHLYSHEVPSALSEFRRILKSDGFALIRCPDLEVVASALLDHGPDDVTYVSPIGPITPLDILFGHSDSIAGGKHHMAHKTGFTAARLGQLLLNAGFATVLTRTEKFDLWALALMARTDQSAIRRQFDAAHFDMFDDLD